MKDFKDKLTLLLELVADGLIERLKSGEATAADLRVAKDFLRDNGITAEDLQELKQLTVSVSVADLDNIEGLDIADLQLVVNDDG